MICTKGDAGDNNNNDNEERRITMSVRHNKKTTNTRTDSCASCGESHSRGVNAQHQPCTTKHPQEQRTTENKKTLFEVRNLLFVSLCVCECVRGIVCARVFDFFLITCLRCSFKPTITSPSIRRSQRCFCFFFCFLFFCNGLNYPSA